MKKRKQRQKSQKIKKISMTQEEAEISYSETHLVEELLRRRTDETPDFLDLKLKDHHFVFVYGTLKSGERNTFLLDGCPFVGDGRVAAKTFVMRLSKQGTFPIIFDAKTKEEKRDAETILGEVYVVDAKTLLELDQLESNGVMFKREKRWVWLDDQRVNGKNGKKNLIPAELCWVYIGNPLYWQGRDVLPYPPTKYTDRTVYDYEETEAKKVIDKKVKGLNDNIFNSWAYGSSDHDDDFSSMALPF